MDRYGWVKEDKIDVDCILGKLEKYTRVRRFQVYRE